MNALFRVSLVAATGFVASGVTSQSTLIIPQAVSSGAEGNGSGPALAFNERPRRDQTIYDAINFTSAGVTAPIDIFRLRWRANGGDTSNVVNYPDVDIRVAPSLTTSDNPSRLFDENFANGKPLPVVEGALTVAAANGATPGNFVIDVIFNRPVRYDPTTGQALLIEFDFAFPTISTTQTGVCALDGPSTSQGDTVDTVHVSANFPSDLELGYPWRGNAAFCEVNYTVASGPTADFRVSTETIGAGSPVSFQDLSSTTDPGGLIAWAWDFDNDGQVDSTDPNPSWSFSACGPTTISLTVTDAAGASDTFTYAGFETAAPEASFEITADPSSMIAPAIVFFRDTSTNNPSSWDWDLDGDGVTDSTQQNPVWVYPQPGFAGDVTLTTTNACGTSTATKRLRIATSAPTFYSGWFEPGFDTVNCPVYTPIVLASTTLPPIEGEPVHLFIGSPPNDAAIGAILVSGQKIDIPLGAFGAPGCSLYVDPVFSVPVDLTQIVPQMSFLAPPPADFAGQEFHFQAAALSPASNALGAVFSRRKTFAFATAVDHQFDAETAPGITAWCPADRPGQVAPEPYFHLFNNSQTGEQILSYSIDLSEGGPEINSGWAYFNPDTPFETGNAGVLDPNCANQNSYAGTDLTTGLVYAGTAPASCGSGLGATTGWRGEVPGFSAGDYRRLEFDFQHFDPGEAFKFNCPVGGSPDRLGDGLNECTLTIVTDQRVLTGHLQFRDASSTFFRSAVQQW